MPKKTVLKSKGIVSTAARSARQQRIAKFLSADKSAEQLSQKNLSTSSKQESSVPKTVTSAAAKINGVKNYIDKNLSNGDAEKKLENTVLAMEIPEKKYAPGSGADVVRASSATLAGAPLNFMRKVRQKVFLKNMKIENANNEAHSEILKEGELYKNA